MMCAASGPGVAIPSRTAARDPARFTTRVLPDTPAGARQPGVGGSCRQARGAQRLGDSEELTVRDGRRWPRA